MFWNAQRWVPPNAGRRHGRGSSVGLLKLYLCRGYQLFFSPYFKQSSFQKSNEVLAVQLVRRELWIISENSNNTMNLCRKSLWSKPRGNNVDTSWSGEKEEDMVRFCTLENGLAAIRAHRSCFGKITWLSTLLCERLRLPLDHELEEVTKEEVRKRAKLFCLWKFGVSEPFMNWGRHKGGKERREKNLGVGREEEKTHAGGTSKTVPGPVQLIVQGWDQHPCPPGGMGAPWESTRVWHRKLLY